MLDSGSGEWISCISARKIFELAKVAGSSKAKSIIKDGLYLVSFGSSDQYASYLVGIFSSFIQDLCVTSLPPIGCVQNFNSDAQNFCKKLISTATKLSKQHSDLNLVVFDIYQPFHDLIQNPSKSGFAEARRGCCGTGLVETTSFLCNPKSIGTCINASQYVFWDSVHPSEAANQVLADTLITQGIALIG